MSEENTILEFDQDISTVEAPPPLPAGEYVGTIVSAVVKTSNNTGNKYVEVRFRVDPEQYPADFDASNDPDGVDLYWRRLMYDTSQRGMYRMRKWCETIGCGMSSRIDPSEWIGLEGRLEVSNKPDQDGVDRAEIDRVHPVS